MENIKILINLFFGMLIVGGLIWSMFSLVEAIVKSIYVFFTRTIKIRKKNKQIVTGVVKNKKYYKPRCSSKPSHTDIPAIYELIVNYDDKEYIITTNRKVYKNYEINDSIDLLLIKFLDYEDNLISYNLKIHK